MSMVVRSNMNAMNANRNLSINNGQVAKSLEKLASGYAINRAGDDAAGLAISEKMKAQIKGLEQASDNSQDGISLIQTAEGGMNEIHDMLNRMVELATKSANGTIQDDVDRDAIQLEVDALLEEIDRIADATNFNGIDLLNGNLQSGFTGSKDVTLAAEPAVLVADFASDLATLGGGTTTSYAADASSLVAAETSTSALTASETFTVTWSDSVGQSFSETITMSNANLGSSTTSTVQSGGTGLGMNTAATTSYSGTVEATLPTDGSAARDAAINSIVTALGTAGAVEYTITGSTVDTDASLASIASETTGDLTGQTFDFNGTEYVVDATASNLSDVAGKIAADTGLTVVDNNDGTLSFSDTAAVTAGEATEAIDGTALTLQVGDTYDPYNKVSVDIKSLKTADMGVAKLDVSSQDASGEAIDTIKDAINYVSSERANLGALQNRLEYTINNLDNTAENMTSANSTIRDTDMASEMMEYTKMNVLVQSAQSMLAQANQAPQQILSLLG